MASQVSSGPSDDVSGPVYCAYRGAMTRCRHSRRRFEDPAVSQSRRIDGQSRVGERLNRAPASPLPARRLRRRQGPGEFQWSERGSGMMPVAHRRP